MALTVPDVEDFKLHIHRTTAFSSLETQWAEDALQRATDLARIATGLTEDPVGPDDDPDFPMRVLTNGILAMAHAIDTISGEDMEAQYSPFSSERLGSYSYSKALAAVQEGLATGVDWFDGMVAFFASGNASALISMSSEKVFKEPYTAYEDETYTYPDPSFTTLFGE